MDIFLFMLIGFISGTAKAGVKGIGTVTVPIFALVFGAKASTGILLPILIFADTGAVLYYYKQVDWYQLKKILPAAIIGVVLATWFGNSISELTFKYLMGSLILICIILLLLWEQYGKDTVAEKYKSFGYGMGVGLGFTTMIGNLAGPLMNIYMLMIKLPKTVFIATSAIFFYIINIFKIPFHIYVWKTITFQTFLLDLLAIPAIIVGLYFGVYVVKMMSEKFFKGLVLITTALSAFVLLLN